MKVPASLTALAILGASAIAVPAQAEDKIGFIYVGPAADYGYNTSMDLGRRYVEKNMPGVTTTAFELIPETAEVERVMERLIAGGHKIIFATSYGYLDYAIKVGEKHPDVTILHAGGLKTSKNVGTYWADSDAGMYLAGVAAAHVTKSGKLGFQGGFQIPSIRASPRPLFGTAAGGSRRRRRKLRTRSPTSAST
jgi:basic membrane protein A